MKNEHESGDRGECDPVSERDGRLCANQQLGPDRGTLGNVPDSPAGSSTQDQNSAANEPLRQEVRDNLTKAGFTDIRIMPTSFMIRAKDQSGNPVMMVINPDSFTEVTAVSPNNNNNDKNGAPNTSNSAAGQKH